MSNTDVLRYPAEPVERALEEFPTPFFLYEEERIRIQCRAFVDAFAPLFPGFTPLFAVKANPNPHILRIIQEEGFGMDCSSLSELGLARALGAGGMHTGNYTMEEELRAALATPKMLLNLDDLSLLATVERIGVPEFLSFRINPGIGEATIESNVLAGPDAKYGVPWERAVEGYRRARDIGVRRFGIHMMTGSNVPSEDYFAQLARRLLQVTGTVQRDLQIRIECLNIGGGFNVPYRPDEPTFDLGRIARGIRRSFDEECAGWSVPPPTLMVEPGRRIAADAGFLVGRVCVIKEGYKKFIGVDVSTNAMPRPAFYGAYHHISVLGKNPEEGVEQVSVVGSICENCDQFARDRDLPVIAHGDVVIIHNCGAHALAMSHNYNGKLRPAEILLESSGKLRLIRRSETPEDLLRTVADWPFVLLRSS